MCVCVGGGGRNRATILDSNVSCFGIFIFQTVSYLRPCLPTFPSLSSFRILKSALKIKSINVVQLNLKTRDLTRIGTFDLHTIQRKHLRVEIVHCGNLRNMDFIQRKTLTETQLVCERVSSPFCHSEEQPLKPPHVYLLQSLRLSKYLRGGEKGGASCRGSCPGNKLH